MNISRVRLSALLTLAVLAVLVPAGSAEAQIRVDPNGVNVNAQGATTVFLTFGGLDGQVAAEAFWCGELISAAPDVGLRCDPATIFGRLPIRYDQSRLSGTRGFTDIMSIPPSVARRAYQAAADGATSSFFYVRRFVSEAGGPDEYVAVTCRMSGGGARTPLSLTDVRLGFAVETPLLQLRHGEPAPPFGAEITYNGTGRLKGRWEVVLPGEELPEPADLLTEATLPADARGTQRRYAELSRFNLFLPPAGSVSVPGPDASRLPTTVDGVYLILLRIEATDDKEGNSNLANAGAGAGVVPGGAVAGFPMPVLRYVVGSGGSDLADVHFRDGLSLLHPADGVTLPAAAPLTFTWQQLSQAGHYRLDVESSEGVEILSAIVPSGVAGYRAPPWLAERVTAGAVRWRVVGTDLEGSELGRSGWRRLTLAAPAPESAPSP
jgi:hypothetical protein